MIFRTNFTLLFLILHTICTAQNSGVAIYRCIGKDSKVNFFRLYFNNEHSLFVGNKSKVENIYRKVNPPISINDTLSDSNEIMRSAMQSGNIITYTYRNDLEGNAIFKDFKNGFLIERILGFSDIVLINEPKLSKLTWVLLDSTKKIGKFSCQNAKTNFRGRVYEAWYTLEIPVSNGPWKLHGLPGLIIEAQSLDRKYAYSCLEIESLKSDSIFINPPMTGEKMSIFNYQKELLNRDNQFASKAISDSEARGITITFVKSDDNDEYQELNFDDKKK